MLLMICFPYVFDRYESEAILNLVLGGEIFGAKVARRSLLTERLAIPLNICRVLRIVFQTHREDVSLFFWIDGKVLLIFLITRFHLLDSFVLLICLL